MRTIYKLTIYFILLATFLFMNSCSKDEVISTNYMSPSVPASDIDAKYALDWMDIEYRIISDQHRDSPPPPSRLYAYSCITIYECVQPGILFSRTLAGQLHDMPAMPSINYLLEYDWPSVIAGAMPLIIRNIHDTLFPNAINLINQKHDEVVQERSSNVSQEVINRSLTHGEAIANRIIQWSRTDNYKETRSMTYTPPPRSQNPKYWEPINPGDVPDEPYWGTLRTFVAPSPQYFYIPNPVVFSTNAGSQFYNEAMEIVTVSQTLTLEQKTIANFWNDKVRTGTPSGHWVSIMNQIARQFNLKLDKTVQMYALLGPAIADAFIICWWAKYQENLLRPQSYIRDYINPNWFPFLITPPFPAYPSGHSTLSGACAEIMTRLYGTVAFTDYTHQQINYAPRSFSSFNNAATEAAFSRLYGGIHYRSDMERGLEVGHNLGSYVFENIRLTSY